MSWTSHRLETKSSRAEAVTSPVFDLPWDRLRDYWIEMISDEARVVRVSCLLAAGALTVTLLGLAQFCVHLALYVLTRPFTNPDKAFRHRIGMAKGLGKLTWRTTSSSLNNTNVR